MRLFKYRDFSDPATVDVEVERLEMIAANSAFWCARPDTLNDPDELNFRLDTTPTRATEALLVQMLVENRPQSRGEALATAQHVLATGRLDVLAQPVIADMLEKIRETAGIISFATTNDSDTMWRRYGGTGAGVCVELEVPDAHIGSRLHALDYVNDRTFHFDDLWRATRTMQRELEQVFKVIYLTKSTFWADEREYRFVSTQPCVWHRIVQSHVVCVHLGNRLSDEVSNRIEAMLDSLVDRVE